MLNAEMHVVYRYMYYHFSLNRRITKQYIIVWLLALGADRVFSFIPFSYIHSDKCWDCLRFLLLLAFWYCRLICDLIVVSAGIFLDSRHPMHLVHTVERYGFGFNFLFFHNLTISYNVVIVMAVWMEKFIIFAIV